MPVWLFEPMDMLGKATIPMAMLATGAILAQSTAAWKGRELALAFMAFFKLAVLPFVAFIILKPFKINDFHGIWASVVLLQAAMPSLASSGVYARRFGGDAALAATGSLITTVLCLITLPLWLALWAGI
jgi:predicted permease